MAARADRISSGWLAVVLALAAGASGCSRTPPEEALRQTIAGLEDAAEQRDAAALRDGLAEDFIGPDGMDQQGLARLAQGVFLRHKGINANLGPLDMDVRGERATVRFTAAVTGGEGVLPESGQVYDVDTEWRLEDGEWRLVRANWKPQL